MRRVQRDTGEELHADDDGYFRLTSAFHNSHADGPVERRRLSQARPPIPTPKGAPSKLRLGGRVVLL